MELKGQVTISIEDFEKLKAAAEQKEYAENRLQEFRDRMTQFYEMDDTEFSDFWKCIEEISSKPMTDRQVDKALSKARGTLKIIHIDLSNTTDKELKAIKICFREKED